jgi:hypothetical protein
MAGTRYKHGTVGLLLLVLAVAGISLGRSAPSEQLVYHQIKTDSAGNVLPWYSPDPGASYNHVILKIWQFWKNMKSCPNGVKYYLQHQVWDDPEEDPRGLGGDQLAMALSSWNLLYAYTGDRAVVENMVYIADYYISHSLSSPDALWPNLPYPYNTELHSGVYDGDMRAGKGFLQPDKAGSFAAELVVLYKITGDARYLQTAVAIADTLANKITLGDKDHSPWPYRVNAQTGEVSLPYTTNYTGTLRLFDDLIRLNRGNVAKYASAFKVLSDWLNNYPLKNNKWGPFFEDVPGWSDSEINADTMAWYMLEHPEWNPNWREDAKAILAWTRAMFENDAWLKFGVKPTNEQTAYRVPGNSHTSRHASVKLLYAEKAGETSAKAEAIRQLNWATYMVGDQGNNCYPYDMVWLTDGYGDYVRHYLRAMAAAPELAPKGQNHLLRSSSVIKSITYMPDSVSYATFDDASQELLRIAFTPTRVTAGGKRLIRLESAADLNRQEGYTFNAPGDVPGVLRIRHDAAGNVEVTGRPVNQPPAAKGEIVTVNQNSSVAVKLVATDDGLPEGGGLALAITGPYHGKLSGTAPLVTYTPEQDFLGTDLLIFRASDGELEGNKAQISFKVVRPNLAQLSEARPFTTEDPHTGASGVFALPALTDDDLTTSVNAAFDRDAPREVALGVLWPNPQKFRQVVFRQGPVSDAGNGFFIQGCRLQVTSDGSAWQDANDYVMTPANYLADERSSMRDFVFTFASAVAYRGVRVTGKVGKIGKVSSTYPRVREFQVFPSLSASRGPEIEYQPANQTVAEGGKAIFGVRPDRTALVTYQWQKSTDKGKSWEAIPGADSSYYETPPARFPTDNGTLYRCVVSNGTAPDAISKPATLTVRPAGSGRNRS